MNGHDFSKSGLPIWMKYRFTSYDEEMCKLCGKVFSHDILSQGNRVPRCNPSPERTPEEWANVASYGGVGRAKKDDSSYIQTLVSIFAQAIEQGRQVGLAEGWEEGIAAYQDWEKKERLMRDNTWKHPLFPENPYRTSTTTPKP